MRLFIAEKPSLGKAIADTIGTEKKHRGYIECKGGDVVTWCIGHLLEQAEPEAYGKEYKEWTLETLPIVPREWLSIAKPDTKDQLKVVTGLIKKADALVNAGDPDREGNLLVNEVIDYAKTPAAKRDSALRILVNDLNPRAIQKALDNLEPNSQHINNSNAALCRSRADWLLGMNMTRACSIAAKRQGYATLFSVGRVQTPTLQLVVRRDTEIANFKPVAFYDIDSEFSHDGMNFKARWQVPEEVAQDKRCLDKTVAVNMIKAFDGNTASVTAYETKRARSQPPLPFTLRTLQEAMSAKYGYGAKQTLDLAQSLYETHKLTSYPRTDKPYLSTEKRSEIEAILANLEGVNDSPLSAWAANADMSLSSPCWNDKKLEGAAHTGIIPTLRAPDLTALDEKERNVYTAIACRYIAQFYPVAEDDSTVIELAMNEHTFKTSGKVEVVKGWREVLGKDREKNEAQTLPPLTQGLELTCDQAHLLEKKTTPPKPFTEGTLLTAMSTVAKEVTNPAYKAKLKETAGLGTEATRAGIIETLKERKYLATKGKNIVSTELGKMLIVALPSRVRDPALTAIWEQQLDVIEKGDYTIEQFMERIEGVVSGLIDDIKSGKEPFSLPANTAPRCPQKDCNGWVNAYDGKKGRSHRCSHCETRFKDDNGKVGKAIKKIMKMEI